MLRRMLLVSPLHLPSNINCGVDRFLGLCTKERTHRLCLKHVEMLEKIKISPAWVSRVCMGNKIHTST